MMIQIFFIVTLAAIVIGVIVFLAFCDNNKHTMSKPNKNINPPKIGTNVTGLYDGAYKGSRVTGTYLYKNNDGYYIVKSSNNGMEVVCYDIESIIEEPIKKYKFSIGDNIILKKLLKEIKKNSIGEVEYVGSFDDRHVVYFPTKYHTKKMPPASTNYLPGRFHLKESDIKKYITTKTKKK